MIISKKKHLLIFLLILSNQACKKEEIVPFFISTSLVTDITASSAKCGGFIQNGEVDSYGVCWSTHETPTIDENIYNTIVIGTQTWMSENLKVTHLNDGREIPHVMDAETWIELKSPAFCYFLNDSSSYEQEYGAYYNWYTVNTGKLCPTGWHIPDWDEWKKLKEYLQAEVGGKMKEMGYKYWYEPNSGASNSSGFSGRGGGLRHVEGNWGYLRSTGIWWASSHGTDDIHAHCAYLKYDDTSLTQAIQWRICGMNVRCLQD